MDYYSMNIPNKKSDHYIWYQSSSILGLLNEESFTPPSTQVNQKEVAASDSNNIRTPCPIRECPKFDGENPKKWIERCDQYFRYLSTFPEEYKVPLTGIYMEGRAMQWYREYTEDREVPSWHEFTKVVIDQFEHKEIDSEISERVVDDVSVEKLIEIEGIQVASKVFEKFPMKELKERKMGVEVFDKMLVEEVSELRMIEIDKFNAEEKITKWWNHILGKISFIYDCGFVEMMFIIDPGGDIVSCDTFCFMKIIQVIVNGVHGFGREIRFTKVVHACNSGTEMFFVKNENSGSESVLKEEPFFSKNLFCKAVENVRDIEFDRVDIEGSAHSGPLVRLPFASLFDTLGMCLTDESSVLLLYSLVHANSDFLEYVMVRTDLDTLLMPMLETLYNASRRTSNHICMVLVIFLILSQDSSFNASIHKQILPDVPWYRILHQTSLGSRMAIILIRTVKYNLSKLWDIYLHTNCLATLANMTPHVHRLSAYASQRLVSLFDLLSRKYNKLAEIKNAKVNMADSDRKGDNLLEDPSAELHIYTDFLRFVLEIINAILTYALPSNPEVVYAIMHKQEVFLPFKTHQRFNELLENIYTVLDFFNNRMDAQETVGEWSMEKVLQVIINNYRSWRGNGMKMFTQLRFTYEQESHPDEFFIPYEYGKGRLHDRSTLLADIVAIKPTHVFNVAGVIGRPNVDWCETHKTETIRTNVAGTLTLADVCREQGLLMISFATWWIFEYVAAHPEIDHMMNNLIVDEGVCRKKLNDTMLGGLSYINLKYAETENLKTQQLEFSTSIIMFKGQEKCLQRHFGYNDNWNSFTTIEAKYLKLDPWGQGSQIEGRNVMTRNYGKGYFGNLKKTIGGN